MLMISICLNLTFNGIIFINLLNSLAIYMNKYKIIKWLSKKPNHSIALASNNNNLFVLKKFNLVNKKSNKMFQYEKIINLNNQWSFVPKVVDHDENSLALEYFESITSNPEEFEKIVDIFIIRSLIDKLLSIKKGLKIKGAKKHQYMGLHIFYFLIMLYPSILSITQLFKIVFSLLFFYIKSIRFFLIPVRTKGDFTEVNILINKNKEIKIIDFADYYNKGYLLQDATYLALHQDIPIKKMEWQKIFLKEYCKHLGSVYRKIDEDYLKYWLLFTSLRQLVVRYNQYEKCINNNCYNNTKIYKEMVIKKKHLQFFLTPKLRNNYIKKILH